MPGSSPISTASAQSKPTHVFLSYSWQPSANVEFVRILAGWLRKVNMEVWLDEEQIPAGANLQQEIKKAVDVSDAGVFVVTSRWLQRDWTQYELTLFSHREHSRRLVLLREKTDLGDLGPYLTSYKTILWFADEPHPYARFWELYCGIIARAPGPRDAWSVEGRRLVEQPGAVVPRSLSPAPPLPQPAAVAASETRLPLPCQARPTTVLASESVTYLVTDAHEWISVSPAGEVQLPPRRQPPHAAAIVTPAQDLVIAPFEPIVLWRRGSSWQQVPQEAPILALCAWPGGVLTGSASGGLSALDENAALPPLRIREPVVALAACNGFVVAVGSRGFFGRLPLPWPAEAEFAWIDTRDLGRPLGFFQPFEADLVGVYSARKVGLLDPRSGRLTLFRDPFEEGIRDVLFLGPQTWAYAVLTDIGRVYLLNAALLARKLAPLPVGAIVVGCAPGGALPFAPLWTAQGVLYGLKRDGAIEELAEDHVILAAVREAGDVLLHIVRWEEGGSATMENRSFR